MKFRPGVSPVPQQARFDVRTDQRALEQRVVQQIDLTHRQVVRRAEPAVQRIDLRGFDGAGRDLHPAARRIGTFRLGSQGSACQDSRRLPDPRGSGLVRDHAVPGK